MGVAFVSVRGPGTTALIYFSDVFFSLTVGVFKARGKLAVNVTVVLDELNCFISLV